MFIKKDLRKIPEILRDAAAAAAAASSEASSATTTTNKPTSNHDDDADGDDRTAAAKESSAVLLTSLHLARRKDEFPDGKVKCLTEPASTSSSRASELLQSVQSLSLYDCDIHDVTGLGLSMTNLQDLCLGRNPITALPDDVSNLSKLQRPWLDDCRLPSLPSCVTDLANLQELRMSHNQLKSLPDTIDEMVELKVLCVDHNLLEALPTRLPPFLTTLQVRENQLTSLPALPNTLKLLQASTNRITTINEAHNIDDDTELMSLTHVYLNGNQLTDVPIVFLKGCWLLKRLNVSHNNIEELSDEFQQRHGLPDAHGICRDNVAWLVNNPVVDRLHNHNSNRQLSSTSRNKGASTSNDNQSDAADDDTMMMDVDDEPQGKESMGTAGSGAPPAVLA